MNSRYRESMSRRSCKITMVGMNEGMKLGKWGSELSLGEGKLKSATTSCTYI